MAHDGALLCPPALPEILACRRWLLGPARPARRGRGPATMAAAQPPQRPARPDAPGPATPAARGPHRRAAELLGQRLVSIVPQELREAHLAGFGRYLITAEPRLIGRPVTVPVLRSDGTRTDITLELAELDLGTDRTAFLATITSPTWARPVV
jgi:hypothetical protein